MMRFVDIMYALPYILFVILLMVIFGRNVYLLFAAIGALEWLTMARIVRGQTLSIKQREYIEAARASGLGTFAIIFKHIIPNLAGPVVIYAALTVPEIIVTEVPVLSRFRCPGTADVAGHAYCGWRQRLRSPAMAALVSGNVSGAFASQSFVYR